MHQAVSGGFANPRSLAGKACPTGKNLGIVGAMTTQPNIVLIMADQMAAPFMAPWGGPAITPAIDRLAAEGWSSSRPTAIRHCVRRPGSR